MPKGLHNNHPRGSNHYRWNDGRIISSDGYVKIRVGVSHPLADPNGYAYEHLVVWVSAGNLRPGTGYEIHHRNEDKTDNRIENLALRTKREHSAEHGRLKLSDEKIVDIRTRYANGSASQDDLASEYFIPRQRISKIVHGKIWKSSGGPISVNDHRTKDPRTGRFTRPEMPICLSI